jgi:hypothetical protein
MALKEGQTTNRTRFTEEQIIGVLNEAEAGANTDDLGLPCSAARSASVSPGWTTMNEPGDRVAASSRARLMPQAAL